MPIKRNWQAKGSQILELAGVLVALWLTGLTPSAWGDTLPYPVRTQPYSVFPTSVRGDIRTVGMSGATTGLADTFVASFDNPAGLAMTVNTGDINFTSNSVQDGYVQNYNNPMNSSSGGALLSPYPWGFGFGYASPSYEGQKYYVPALGVDMPMSVWAREFLFSASRVLMNNRLALGVTLRSGRVEEQIGDAISRGYGLGLTLGAMVQFHPRILLGASYSTPMRYRVDGYGDPNPSVAGFFQDAYVPFRASLGIGWIPNRFLRSCLSLTVLGNTGGTALLRDQTIFVGNDVTLQPRFGVAYVFADFKEFSGTAFMGSYLEVSRISGTASRFHGSGGVEVKPWIFTIGLGVDTAETYNNYLASIGVDIFKTMEKLELIPRIPHSPYHGFGSHPFTGSDEGLARPLVRDWKPTGPEVDPIKIGLDIPNRLQKKVDDWMEMVGVGTPTPKPGSEQPKITATPRKKRKSKKKPAGDAQKSVSQ